MSDRDDDLEFGDEFGEVRFQDDPTPDDAAPLGATELLPQYSEPAAATERIDQYVEPSTIENPVFADSAPRTTDEGVAGASDVWSAFRDDDREAVRRPSFEEPALEDDLLEPAAPPPVRRPARENRIVIGTDPTAETRRPSSSIGMRSKGGARGAQRPGQRPGGGRPIGGPPTGGLKRPAAGPKTGRDLPSAIAVGALLASAFIAAVILQPLAVLAIVVICVGLATFEFYIRAEQATYKPVMVVGVAASAIAPIVAYAFGDGALPMVLAFAMIAVGAGFVASEGIGSRPLPNVAMTMLPVVWVGLLGSYAGLILRLPNVYGLPDIGTDTMFIVVAGVVGHDVLALAVGSVMGRTPLRQWISPNKTVEGFIGGVLGTVGAVVAIGARSDTWNDPMEWVLLTVVITVLAPLGDLVESMFKRNLDVKDFGTVLPGHGGALDRFDSLLFVLPGAYYLAVVLEPWVI
ncbi:MAG: phosphatidate cytidylyltransferase [Acidobacteria bacterium]|nr:phosphatidate cytidylyltransferase [Acidobacteriota bacterium]